MFNFLKDFLKTPTTTELSKLLLIFELLTTDILDCMKNILRDVSIK